MADDNQIEIKITLDDGSVVKGIANVKKELQKTASETKKTGETLAESFDDTRIGSFVSKIKTVHPAILGITATIVAFGAAFKAALAGEEIEKINRQFDILAKQAGLSSDILRDGLIESAKGLADTEDILKAASGAILTLGDNAQRLPELFDVARRAASVFGVDTIQAFEQLSTAVASGSQKQLRALGLTVDTKRAYDDLAKSLGITSEQLNQSQKQFAVLNATLAAGQNNYKDVGDDTETLSGSFKRLRVSIGELGDDIFISIKRTFGDFFISVVNGATKAIDAIRAFKTLIGDQADVVVTNKDILEELKKKYEQNAKAMRSMPFSATADFAKQANIALYDQITALEALIKKNEERKSKEQKGNKPGSTIPGLDVDQIEATNKLILAKNNEFINAKLAADKTLLDTQLSNSKLEQDDKLRRSEENRILQAQLALEDQAFKQKQIEIDTQFSALNKGTDDQRKELQLAAEAQHQANILDIKAKAGAADVAAAKARADQLKSVVVGGITSTVQSMAMALKRGENIFSAFAGGVANLIGDLAIQIGGIFVAAGVAQLAVLSDPGTGTIIAGAALIAAGTLFKAAFGSGGASAPSSGGGGSGASFAESASTEDGSSLNEAIQEKQTNVKIDVGGTVLDPVGVGRQIAQILSDTFEATGTKVVTS